MNHPSEIPTSGIRLQAFSKDRLMARNIATDRVDPFFTQVANFPFRLILAPELVDAWATQLPLAFDSFRVRLVRDGRSALKATVTASEPVRVRTIRAPTSDQLRLRTPKELLEEERVINLFDGPAFLATHLVCPETGQSVLRLVYSHFSADLISMQIVHAWTRAFFSEAAPRVSNAGYIGWMDALGSYAAGPHGSREFQHWANASAGGFDALRSATQHLAGSRFRCLSLKGAAGFVADLAAASSHWWSCRIVDAVGASIVYALAAQFERRSVPASWTAHGRYPVGGVSFLATAGWLSDEHPVEFAISAARKDTLTRSIREALVAVPNAGCTFGWVARFAGTTASADLQEKFASPISINMRQRPVDHTRLISSGGTQRPLAIGVEADEQGPPKPFRLYFAVDLSHQLKITCKATGSSDAVAIDSLMESIARNLHAFAYDRGSTL